MGTAETGHDRDPVDDARDPAAVDLQLDRVLHAAPVGLLLVDAQGVIRTANAELESLFGYGPGELAGRPVETLVPESERDRHPALRSGYFAGPDRIHLGRGRDLFGVRKDGSPVPVEIRLGPLETAGGTFALASVVEISARMAVEHERDRFFELTRDLIVINGIDGILRRVNPAVLEGLGFGEDELIGRSFVDFVHPDDRARALGRFRQRLNDDDGQTTELRCLCKDGSSKVVLWSAVFDPERDVIYAVGHDITDRKREETELRRATRMAKAMNRELEAFSYSVSHDLRVPLRSIEGFSLALLDEYRDVLDGEGLRYLGRVRHSVQRMSNLIDDLLRLSRISRTEPKPETVDLSRIANAIVEELRQQDPEREVDVEIQQGVEAIGDAGLLQVALRNLLENAWKYTSKRDHASIEFGRAFVEGEPAYFVRDDGAGFDMAYADRLFGAFQRLHDATEFEGTGIGLATVRRIVNLHGGRLWADAAVDEGAEFFFTLAERGVRSETVGDAGASRRDGPAFARNGREGPD
jgi:PAS domain S-box-containing protein